MKFYLSILTILICTAACAQDKSFYELVTTADSVVAIGHQTTSNSDMRVVDQRGNEVRKPDLTINGQINPEILTNKVVLDDAQIKAFTSLLNSNSKFSIQGTCFNPQHALLIYKDGVMGVY